MLYQAPPSDALKKEGSIGGQLETEPKDILDNQPENTGQFVVPEKVRDQVKQEIKTAIETAKRKEAGSATVDDGEDFPRDEKEVRFDIIEPKKPGNLVEISGENTPNSIRVVRLRAMLATLAHHNFKPGATPYTIAQNELGLGNKPEES